MVPSHRRAGFADAAALFPIEGTIESDAPGHARWVRNKVAAGETPAAIARLKGGTRMVPSHEDYLRRVLAGAPSYLNETFSRTR